MSDFYENPENTRLLKKVQLKEQSGMNIKSDVIELMAAAFESMSDEDWIRVQQQQEQLQQLFNQYCPEISKLPLVAIQQLVQAMQLVLMDIRSHQDVSFIDELLLQQISAKITNCNDIILLYIPNSDVTTQIANACMDNVPDSFESWIDQYISYCQKFLAGTEEPGELLIQITFYHIHAALFRK